MKGFMKVGDMVEVPGKTRIHSQDELGDISTEEKEYALVIREMTFKEYCDKHDDLMLEYDIDSCWIEWEKHGPTFEVLRPDGKLLVMWDDCRRQR